MRKIAFTIIFLIITILCCCDSKQNKTQQKVQLPEPKDQEWVVVSKRIIHCDSLEKYFQVMGPGLAEISQEENIENSIYSAFLAAEADALRNYCEILKEDFSIVSNPPDVPAIELKVTGSCEIGSISLTSMSIIKDFALIDDIIQLYEKNDKEKVALSISIKNLKVAQIAGVQITGINERYIRDSKEALQILEKELEKSGIRVATKKYRLIENKVEARVSVAVCLENLPIGTDYNEKRDASGHVKNAWEYVKDAFWSYKPSVGRLLVLIVISILIGVIFYLNWDNEEEGLGLKVTRKKVPRVIALVLGFSFFTFMLILSIDWIILSGLLGHALKGDTDSAYSPPYLTMESIGLTDENDNKLFEAGESAKLSVEVSNTGKGLAPGVKVKITGFISRELDLGEIEPNETATKELRFDIPIRVSTGKKQIEVFVDAGEFSPPVRVVKFTTRAAVPPAFKVAVKVDDDMSGESTGNGNGAIEPREKVELRVSVANTGKGFAKGVVVRAKSVAKGVNLLKSEAKIGNLPPGATESGDLVVFVPADYKDKKLPLELEVAEELGLWQVAKTVEFAVQQEGSAVVSVSPTYGFESQAEMASGVFTGTIEVEALAKSGKCAKQKKGAFAIITGVYDYKHISKLAYVINDMNLMKHVAQCYFGVPEGNIRIIPNPTRSDFLPKLRDEVGRIARRYKEPKIYFYYSGHGAADTKGDFYLLPYDALANTVENMRETSIALAEVLAELSKAGGEKVALLDACRVETAWKPVVVVKEPEVAVESTAIVHGTGFKQISNVARGKNYSAFTYALYDLFSKGNLELLDKNRDGWLSAAELIEGVNSKLGLISESYDQQAEVAGEENVGVVKILR